MNYWTNAEKMILTNYYGKVKIEELEHKLPGRTRMTIQKHAQLLGLKGNPSLAAKKYYVNDHFFTVPNIQNCYWAGLIAADGSISDVTKGDRENRINITSKDIEIVENFKIHTNAGHPIEQFTNKDGLYYRISCWGTEQWIKDLEKYWNIIPRKSNILQPPNITDEQQILSYIIGYLDGDGYICYNGGYLTIGFCGTEAMMLWIRYNLCKRFGLPSNKLNHNGKSQTNKQIKWRGNTAMRLVKAIKTEIEVPWRMSRKWDIII